MRNIFAVVADNELHSAGALNEYLTAQEIKMVGMTRDGEQLLKYAETRRPDVIIMDTVFNNYDGLSIIRSIRENRYIHQPKIIVYSSLSTNSAIDACIRAGADYFINKPNNFDCILNAIKELVFEDDTDMTIIRNRNDSDKSYDLDKIISEYLHNLGIPANIKGYRYLRTAIKMVLDDMNILESVTKCIYPGVAKVYQSTPSRVERAIRHSIECAFERGRPEYFNAIFGNTSYSDFKPTNSEFIATLSDMINLQIHKVV